MPRTHPPIHPGEILDAEFLARYFGTSEEFWMNLQARYDLEVRRRESGKRLVR